MLLLTAFITPLTLGLTLDLPNVYLFAAIIGVGYVVIALLLGQIGGGAEGGHDLSGGHDLAGGGHDIGGGGHDLGGSGDVHADVGTEGHAGPLDIPGHAGQMAGPHMFGPLSPLILALFLACFGLIGWIAVRPPMNLGRISLVPAVGLALVIAWLLMWGFNKIFARAERTSSPSAYEAVGLEADVITPIQADAPGEIAYVARGARYNAPARSDTGVALPRGARVVIRRREGATYFVAPRKPE